MDKIVKKRKPKMARKRPSDESNGTNTRRKLRKCACINCDGNTKEKLITFLFPGGQVTRANLEKPPDAEMEKLLNERCKNTLTFREMDLEAINSCVNECDAIHKYDKAEAFMQNLIKMDKKDD